MELITDKLQMEAAIGQVVGQEMLLPLRRADFEAICPEPRWAVHVVAESAKDAARQVKAGLAELTELAGLTEQGRPAGVSQLDGLIEYVKSDCLTMAGLETIEAELPGARRFKRGLSPCASASGGAGDPEKGAVEIWIFGKIL